MQWSYNHAVHALWAKSAAVVFMCATMLAQSVAPACPATQPVDDIIGQIHRQQSKRKHRNANPLPQIICIFAWCIDISRTPPTIPETAPVVHGPKRDSGSGTDSSSAATDLSSAKTDSCDTATRSALLAAHNVDVGDYYFFEAKAYEAASLRYLEALEQKPDDAAIHVRLGRALEKLKQFPQAIEQYKMVPGRGPERWSKEANGALLRLERVPDR